MSIKVIICDDISEHRQILKKNLTKYNDSLGEDKENIIIDEAASVNEVVNMAKKNLYDIAFLDIDLNEEQNGLDLSEIVSRISKKTISVFVTAHVDYTKDAMERLVQYYITKPIDYNFFSRVMNKIFFQIREDRFFEENTSVIEVKIGSEKKKIRGNRIVYIEKMDRKIRIYLDNGEILESRGTLNEIEETIDDEMFIRCHKGFIINKFMVDSYSKGNLKMLVYDEDIPVGRTYQKNIQKYVFNSI